MYKVLVLVALAPCLAMMFTSLAELWRNSAEMAQIDKEITRLETEIYGAPVTKRAVWKMHAVTVFVTVAVLAITGVMIYRVVVWL